MDRPSPSALDRNPERVIDKRALEALQSARRTPAISLISISLAVLLAIALSDQVAPGILAGMVITVVATTLANWMFVEAYLRIDPDLDHVRWWIGAQAVLSAAHGLAWGGWAAVAYQMIEPGAGRVLLPLLIGGYTAVVTAGFSHLLSFASAMTAPMILAMVVGMA